MGLILIGILHSLCGGFLNGLQLLFLGLGLGILEHNRGEVELLVAVDVVFLFQQAHGVVCQVDERTLLHLAALGGQAGPLLDDGVDRGTFHGLGVVGVAVFIVQLEDAQPGCAVPGEIHHGQVRPGDGGVGVHVIEQHPCNAAGQINEILIVLQLVPESRIRQGAALADLIAGQQLFDMIL